MQQPVMQNQITVMVQRILDPVAFIGFISMFWNEYISNFISIESFGKPVFYWFGGAATLAYLIFRALNEYEKWRNEREK